MIPHLKYRFRHLQADYYTRKLGFPFDKNWIKGKRVALIGGADSVLQEKKGDYIDSFDLVARINKGVEAINSQKTYVGTRTDLLFHGFFFNEKDVGSSPPTPELWKKRNVGKLCYTTNYEVDSNGVYKLLSFVEQTNKEYPFCMMPKPIHLKWRNELQLPGPTNGFKALCALLYCQPKELYITGMTFFRTGHNQALRNFKAHDHKMFTGENSTHDPERELACFKTMYQHHPKIIHPDDALLKILHSPGVSPQKSIA